MSFFKNDSDPQRETKMARRQRIIISNYPHHIILRGNNRTFIFHSDTDRRTFIRCLLQAKLKTNSKIYAYCLMPNHVHLLIEPAEKNEISLIIQSLGRKYVQYFNRRYKRTGTLWEGRYKSSPVSKDKYLLACSRYIELNPVRAEIVSEPGKYQWSSFGFRAEGKPDELLDEDDVYSKLGATPEERRLAYKRWVEGVLTNEDWAIIRHIRESTQRGTLIGNHDFQEKIAKGMHYVKT